MSFRKGERSQEEAEDYSGERDQTFDLYRGSRHSGKAKTAAKFLADGDKVKVGLRFRGRERDYAAKGMDVMNTFCGSSFRRRRG